MSLPVFDLVTEQPAERISVRRAIRDQQPFGARFARQADARPILKFVVTIRHAREIERRRLVQLWDLTRFGTLPMSFTSPTDGTLTVLFDADELAWRKDTMASTSIRVGLMEAIGA